MDGICTLRKRWNLADNAEHWGDAKNRKKGLFMELRRRNKPGAPVEIDQDSSKIGDTM